MGSQWPVVLGLICSLVVVGRSAVVPTQEALVIAKADNSNPETIAEAVQETSTEGPLPAVKMLELQVRSDVALRYARTTVASLVKNPAHRAQETTFRVLLPQTAFISGFSMLIQGKVYNAYVKEKEEAKQIYNEAVSQGLGAAHVAAKARDSNHFTVNVNIEPNSSVVFNLTYEELLLRRNSFYHHVTNLHPGSLVPKLVVTIHIKEFQKITSLRVPEVSTGNEIAPTEKDAQNAKAAIARSSDDREVTITFKPNLEEQKKLMEIYAQKSKESQANSRRQAYIDDDDESKPEGVLGQFVVQYDVDRNTSNEVMVNDGYFVHFFAPRSLAPLRKFVMFVLDTSGSMSDRKIVQLREAMQTILGELHEGDYFSIIEFASGVKVYDLKEADEPAPAKPSSYVFYEREQTPTLVPPFEATPENIAKAKVIVGRLQAVGGTNIAGALNVAVDLIQKGVCWKPLPVKENITETVAATTEEPTTEILDDDDKTSKPVAATTEEPTTETPNDEFKNSRAIKHSPKPDSPRPEDCNMKDKLEPIIIFLTDGDPTVGETNPKRINTRFSEKNFGVYKASVFSLAFGEDADRNFLRKLSLRNDGFMRHIYEASDAALQLNDFYQQVTSPLLAHVNFTYPPDQVKSGSLTKTKFRTYYEGSEMVVAGRVQPSAEEVSPEVSGFCGVDEGFGRKRYETHGKGLVPKKEKDKSNEFLPLERLWAYLTIKQLLDERDAAEEQDKSKEDRTEPEKKALDLALKYSFVTELTSLVVVKPNATKAVDAESVDNSKSPTGAPLSSPHHAPGIALTAAQFAPSAFRGGASPVYSFAPKRQPVRKTSMHRDTYKVRPASAPSKQVQPAEVTKTLATYHLESYSWVETLIDFNKDHLIVKANGVDTPLKLIKEVDVPQSSSACGRDTNGDAAGACVYLTRCDAAQNISADIYSSSYCIVDKLYAGVCCPIPDYNDTTADSDSDTENMEQLQTSNITPEDVEAVKDPTSNDGMKSNDATNKNDNVLKKRLESNIQDDVSFDENVSKNDGGIKIDDEGLDEQTKLSDDEVDSVLVKLCGNNTPKDAPVIVDQFNLSDDDMSKDDKVTDVDGDVAEKDDNYSKDDSETVLDEADS